jgi:hypothetical protein
MAKDKLFVRISNTDTAPMLSLNLLALSTSRVEADVGEMSITPRTFVSRTFNQSILDNSKSTPDLNDYWFVDKFKNKEGYTVIRFGIDRKGILVDRFNSTLLEEPVKIFSPSSNQSTTGSNNSTQYKPGVQHHKLEAHLVKQAIEYLVSNTNSSTVLVHIFERDGDSIKIDDSANPRTHTVLLYKNSQLSQSSSGVHTKHEILVIDPNNFTYSSHLRELSTHTEFLTLSRDVEIITLHSKKLQIYKPGSTGPSANQYRDCLDVGVKLAFLLSKTNPYIKVDGIQIDEDFLKKMHIIKIISNVPSIDESIIDKNGPIRIKQASDTEMVEKFYIAQKFINKVLKMFSGYLEIRELDKKKEEAVKLLKNEIDQNGEPHYEHVFKDLSRFDQDACSELKLLTEQHHEDVVKLLGN